MFKKSFGVPDIQPPHKEFLKELVLELTDLKFHEENGKRRASAQARLIYEMATSGLKVAPSDQSWRFIAPIGPIEAEELRWYLEKYAVWPSPYFQNRARKVEESLVKMGQLLYENALSEVINADALKVWGNNDGDASRRFSVLVDATLKPGKTEAELTNAREAATMLLSLPWELLHDGKAFIFQGARPTCVRRRLPGTETSGVPVFVTPIRILLVTARPEDESCGYLDHRVSALPLVEATEALPDLVKLRVLNPPTLPALREELDRARRGGTPYHVVHFDGHGFYDKKAGEGGLCFEHPEDTDRPDRRRREDVYTTELGQLLRNYNIPLVFLEACQTAQAENESDSVASGLLREGVTSVVAMSHSVLVETARLFVEAFYAALAAGKKVGDAMLEGQRRLKDDTFRGRVFGVGEFRLEDWFVPVLFQGRNDPQLFLAQPFNEPKEDLQAELKGRLGEMPQMPETGFVGRSRDLLALQRMLRQGRCVVILGQGGEGKTALAAEFARWMVRSNQVHRSAFVSVETHGNVASVLDAIGRQLLGKNYSVATFNDLDKATEPVLHALVKQSTLLIIDNVESILLPPYLAAEMPEAITEDERQELKAILALCHRLSQAGNTRLVFTSREALPEPFEPESYRRELHRLDKVEGVKLIERVLNSGGEGEGANDALMEEIEQLVDAVHGHARTLALLAPALRSQGVEATRESLVELIVDMEEKFPGSREQSVFASVELSLRRLSVANRDRVRVLGVFHGCVDLHLLIVMMEWEDADVSSLAMELIGTGLATYDGHNHLTLNPALCPYLHRRLDLEELDELTSGWTEAMGAYVGFLVQQRSQNAALAATVTVLELPNLFALLDMVDQAGDAEATIELASSLFLLLETLGKPRLLELVGQVRDAAAAALGDAWTHARFQVARALIVQQLDGGNMSDAIDDAQTLLQRARTAGEDAYQDADYDLAMACRLFAHVLKTVGRSKQALPLLEEALDRFQVLEKLRPGCGAESMASACTQEQGDCLRLLGRLAEAVAAYEESIRRDEQRGDIRGVAVAKSQLGKVHLEQRRYQDALTVFTKACDQFIQLDEPGSVATVWHDIGRAYLNSGDPVAAEDAYRQSLRINVLLGNVRGQAGTLNQLGRLYDDILRRPEEAVAFYQQAAGKYVEIGDAANEGRARGNLSSTLLKLGELNEARKEIRRAIECNAQFGHVAEPWKTWAILSFIEKAAGNPTAAAEARRHAIACFLAYRRDGGENHSASGRLFNSVARALRAGTRENATQEIAQYRETWRDYPNPVADALDTIIAGSRDRTLADAPDLDYDVAAEILLLIETLEKSG